MLDAFVSDLGAKQNANHVRPRKTRQVAVQVLSAFESNVHNRATEQTTEPMATKVIDLTQQVAHPTSP
jgi:hypothetical protein